MIKQILLSAIVSMTPVGELRAGLPVAVASGIPLWLAYLVCVAANALIAPLLFFFLEYIHHHFMHYGHYQSMFDRFMERTRRKAKTKIEKFGYLGLLLLVAVPLPFTGAYTGTLAAWFFGMKQKRAIIVITFGVAVAGLIVLGVITTGATAWNWIFRPV